MIISKLKTHQQNIIMVIGYCLVFGISFFLGKASAQRILPPEIKIEEAFPQVNNTQNLLETQSQNNATPPVSNGADCEGKIKGNINSKGEKIYHVPGGSFYKRTIAEQCFNTESEAQAAGFRKSIR